MTYHRPIIPPDRLGSSLVEPTLHIIDAICSLHAEDPRISEYWDELTELLSKNEDESIHTLAREAVYEFSIRVREQIWNAAGERIEVNELQMNEPGGELLTVLRERWKSGNEGNRR